MEATKNEQTARYLTGLSEGGEFTQPLPTNDMIVGRHAPPVTSSFAPLRRAIRLVDPSAELANLTKGERDYIYASTHKIHTELTNEARARVYRVMGAIDGLADWKNIFGSTPDTVPNKSIRDKAVKFLKDHAYNGEPEDLYFFSITKRADGTPLDSAPFIGNVIEKPSSYAMPDYVRDKIAVITDLIEQHRQFAINEGINVPDVTEAFDEIEYFFPRGTIDPRAKLDPGIARAGGAQYDPFEKARLLEEMDGILIERGLEYLGYHDALEAYFRYTYKRVIRKRTEDALSPLIHSQEVSPDILDAATTSARRLERAVEAQNLLNRTKRGYNPTLGQWRVLGNVLPDNRDEFTKLRSDQKNFLPHIMARVDKATFDELGVSREAFWKEYEEGLGFDEWVGAHPETIGSTPHTSRLTSLDVENIQQVKAESARYGAIIPLDDVPNLKVTDLNVSSFVEVPGIGAVRFVPASSGARIGSKYQVNVMGGSHYSIQSAPVDNFEEALPIFKEKVAALQKFEGSPGTTTRRNLDDVFPDNSPDNFAWNLETVQPPPRREALKQFMARAQPTWSGKHQFGGTLSEAAKEAQQFTRSLLESGDFTRAELRHFEQQAFNATFPGRNRHPFRYLVDTLSTDTDRISAINRALSKFNIKGQAAQRLRREVSKATAETFTQEQNALIDTILVKLDEDVESFTLAARTTHAIAEQAKQGARRHSALEAPFQLTGPNIFMDSADVSALDKKFGFSNDGRLAIPYLIAVNGRNLKSVVDLSTPLVQGLHALGNKPKQVWAKQTRDGLMALFDPQRIIRVMNEDPEAITEMIQHGILPRSSDIAKGIEDSGVLGRWVVRTTQGLPDAARLPAQTGGWVINKAIRTFSNSYETFIDAGKYYWWKALRHTAHNEKDLRTLASFVNKVSGTLPGTALGTSRLQQQAEAILPFYAPGYTRAHAALIADMFQHGLRGELARESQKNLFLAVGAMHIAAARILNQEPNFDPTKPEFMSVEIEGVRLGVQNKTGSFAGIGSKIAWEGITNPEGFIDGSFFTREGFESHPAVRGVRSQLSLPAGAVWDTVSGADFLGRATPGLEDPLDLVPYLAKKHSPFWLEAYLEASGDVRDNTDNEIASWIPAVASGLGARSFPTPINTLYKGELDRVFTEEFDMTYEEYQQQNPLGASNTRDRLFDRHPRLQALFQQSRQQQSETRDFAPLRDYLTKRSDNLQGFIEQANAAADIFDTELDDVEGPRRFRETMRSLTARKASANSQLDLDFPEVVGKIEEYHTLRQDGNAELTAVAEFIEGLTSPITTTTTNPDGTTSEQPSSLGVIRPDGTISRARVARLKEYIAATYGPDMLDYLSNYLMEDRLNPRNEFGRTIDTHPTVKEYLALPLQLESYWNLYKEIVPEELHADYEQWDELTTDAKAAAAVSSPHTRILSRYDDLIDSRRKQHRLTNPEVDRLLYRFYGIQPVSPINKGLAYQQKLRVRLGG